MPMHKRKNKMGGGYNDMMPRKKKAMGEKNMDRMTYGEGGLVDFKNPN